MKNNSAVPRLTLGLPTYNGEPFLAESLDALLAQTARSRCLAQIRAARNDQAALADWIRQGTSDYVKEVDSLLEQVAKVTLGFPARPLPTLEKDEIAVWHGR